MILRDTTRHNYRPIDFRRHIRPEDFWKFTLDTDLVAPKTNVIARIFATSNCAVRDITSHDLRGRKVFVTNSLYDTLAVRTTDSILRRVLAFPVFSREDEIRQLAEIVKSERRAVIFRTDISSFFESISLGHLIDSLVDAGFSNRSCINHLKSVNKHVIKLGCTGLPRGLSISSTLAEFAMERFDKGVKAIRSCLYYCRYVDDIIAIFGDADSDIQSNVTNLLPRGLALNPHKTFVRTIGANEWVDFLGYSIELSGNHTVKIAEKKMSSVKKRIVLSLRRYCRDANFDLLKFRLQFLASNTRMRIPGRRTPITVGFRYQYSLCDIPAIESQLKDLDTFYRRILASHRFTLSRRIRGSLTIPQQNDLWAISFLSGYRNRITRALPKETIAQIKCAWQYE